MPKVIVHSEDGMHEGDIPADSNLVVLAGIRKYPFPHLKYRCGMGKCATCASRVIAGAEQLEEPNWKEKKVLGEEKLAEGYRLVCQLRVFEDIEIAQD